MAPGDLARLARATARVERVARELEAAREQLRVEVRAAHKAGVSVSELARSLGVTRTRVYQLLDR